jgi:hypothetical protein
MASASSAVLMVSLAPSLALGEYGIGMRDTLRSYLQGRLRPVRLRGSA